MFIILLLFAAFCNNLIDEFDDLLVNIMSCINSLDHLVFRYFIGTCLNHNYFLTSRSDCQCKIGYGFLLIGWVNNKLTIDHANLCHGTRAIKWNIRNTCCNGRTKHCCQLRAACLIYTQNKIVQCHIISIILREERTHRSVDNSRCKDRILACLSFTLVEPTRNLAYRVHLLFKFNT